MRQLLVAAFLLIVTMFLTACHGSAPPPDQARQDQLAQIVIAYAQMAEAKTCTESSPGSATGVQLPPVNPLEVTGDIISAGSSTVFPLAERMAERFRAEGYAGNITIDSIGSGAGFERFCTAGETDISNASRPIKAQEVENCRAIGREPVEFRIGADALAVVVNPENDWIESATIEQLAALFAFAEKWSDVDPAWPAEPIQRFIPGTDSGTFDYFVEEVFDKEKEPILSAAHVQMSEDDNVLVQGVEGSKYAIGFFGYAFYGENQERLKALAIEGVKPGRESVDAGEYPLARPLFMYSDPAIMQAKPQVAAFLNFVLTYVNDEIVDVGYFPANQETLDQSRQRWLEAMGK